MRIALPAVLVCVIATLTACYGDESIHAYGAADKVWTLRELHGAPFSANATLTFPEAGKIAGSGPCNRFNTTQEVPYPWFKVGPIASTRMACPELQAESAYFDALAKATLSEVAGDTLILSDENGVLLVFKAGG